MDSTVHQFYSKATISACYTEEFVKEDCEGTDFIVDMFYGHICYVDHKILLLKRNKIIPDMDQLIKRYYSIREVCDIFGLNTSVLRHWEKEFRQLRPSKLSGGERRYTASDIEMVRQIYHLLKERGFTIEGARKELASKGSLFAEEANVKKEEVKEKLLAIRERLLAIKKKMVSE